MNWRDKAIEAVEKYCQGKRQEKEYDEALCNVASDPEVVFNAVAREAKEKTELLFSQSKIAFQEAVYLLLGEKE